MKHAIASAEDATSRYSLPTKVLAVFLSVAMVVTFSHFNAFAEFIQGGAADTAFVQVKTNLENAVITDAETQVSYKQADVDALGYLPAAEHKLVTFMVTPYDDTSTPGPDYTLAEVTYGGVALAANAQGQYSFTPVEGATLSVKAVPVASANAAMNDVSAENAAQNEAASNENAGGTDKNAAAAGNEAANAASSAAASVDSSAADKQNTKTEEAANGQSSAANSSEANGSAASGDAASSTSAAESADSSDSANAANQHMFSVNHIGGFLNLFGGINVVVAGQDGMLPADAHMSVSLVKDQNVESMLRDAAAAENQEMVDSVVVDITFTDATGTVIEPNGPVSVNFEGVNLKGDSVGVYHVADDLDKVTPVAELQNASDSFEADHFSTYALVGKIETQPVIPEDQKLVTVNYVSPDGSIVGTGHTEQISKDTTALTFSVSNDELFGDDVTIGAEGGYEVTVSDADKAKYGITITNNQEISFTNLPEAEQITINVIIQGKLAKYRVIEKTQNIDGSYSTKETVVDTGRVGDIASFNPEGKEGFTTVGFLDQVIKADDSTIIEGFYNRNAYTLTYHVNGGSYIEPREGVFEQEVNVFTGESHTDLTCGLEEHEHSAKPTQRADRNQGKTIGCYTSTQLGWGWGSSWEWTLTCGKAEHQHSSSCYSTVSTYDPAPTKPGYAFDGWYLDAACTQPAPGTLTLTADTTVYAKWTAGTAKYNIVYLKETLDESNNSSYSYYTSTEATGTVGTSVSAPSNGEESYYTYVPGGAATIAPDGSTVVYGYYNLTEYTIYFNLNKTGATMSIGGSDYSYSTNVDNQYHFNIKLGQNIGVQWPTSGNIPAVNGSKFYTWNASNWSSAYASKIVYVTEDVLKGAGTGTTINASASWSSNLTASYVRYWLQDASNENLYVPCTEYCQPINLTNGLNAKTLNGFTRVGSSSNPSKPADAKQADGSAVPDINQYNVTIDGVTYGTVYNFYYVRNSADLKFYNGDNSTPEKTVSAKFDASIASENYTPARPAGVDAEAVFAGWYDNANCVGEPYAFGLMPSSNVALYAKWIMPTKDTTIHLNYEGAGEPQVIQVTKGRSVDVALLPSAEELEALNEGYEFTGWYADADCTIKFDVNKPVDSDITIYAGWTKTTKVAYTVKHVAVNDGVETEISEVNGRGTIGQDVKVIKLSDDALAAAGCAGYLSASGASQFMNLSEKASENVITFRYMTLADMKYTVSYVYNGTTVYVENNGEAYDCKSDVAFSVYPNADAQAWLAANGYSLKSTFVKVEPGQNAVFDLKATEFTITYDLGTGSFASTDTAPTTYTVDQVSGESTLAIPNPTSAARTFVGWQLTDETFVNDSATPSKTSVEPNLVLGEVNGYKTVGNLTLKAVWKENLYVFMRFVDTNGNPINASSDDEANTALAKRFNLKPNKSGWYTLGYEPVGIDKSAAEYGIGTVLKSGYEAIAAYLPEIGYSSSSLIPFEDNKNFSRYDILEYYELLVSPGADEYLSQNTPAFHLDGQISIHTVKYVDGVDDEEVFEDVVGYGINGDENPQFGSDPVRPGYTFTGWMSDSGELMSTSEVEASTISGDATYTAQWAAKSYDVTYAAEGAGSVSNTAGDTDLFVLNTDGITGSSATAQQGYKLEGWYKDGVLVSTAETLTSEMIAPHLNSATVGDTTEYQDTHFVAKFVKDESKTHRIGYTVEYYKNGVLAETVPAKYSESVWINDADSLVVTENLAADGVITSGKYAGYHFDSLTINDASLDVPFGEYTLRIEAGQASQEQNVFKVYYVENEDITITYVANEGGTVSNASEVLAPVTGTPKGSVAMANTGYVFDYWSTDAAGQNKVGIDNLYVPEKNAQGVYEEATYYANFKKSDEFHSIAYEIHYFKQNASGAYEEVVADAVNKKSSEPQHILTPATIAVSEQLDANKYEGYTYSRTTQSLNGGAASEISAFPASYINDGQVAGEDAYVINCYYDLRADLSYTVKYYWAGDTTTTIAPDETVGDQTLGAEVSLPADKIKTIEGYAYKNNSGDITISVDENVISVYYYKNVELTANSATKVYNGGVQGVSGFTGAPDDAQFDISVGVEGTTVATYPARFAAGTVGTIDATGNYIVSAVNDGQLTITPLAVSVEIAGNYNTAVYDGAAHTVTGYTASISSSLFSEDLIYFAGSATATRTEVGTTYMGLAADQFESLDTTNFTVSFTVTSDGYQEITPMTSEIIVDIYENSSVVTYDGVEHSVFGYDAAKTTISNPLYTADMFTATETEAWTAKGIDAGTYPVGVDAADFTNNASETFPNVKFVIHDGALTINPITEEVVVTITGNNNTTEYDGSEHSVSGYQVTSISNAAYHDDMFAFDGVDQAARTEVGTTYMNLNASQFANRETTNFTNVTFVVNDGFQAITPVASEVVVTITGNNNTAEYDGAEHRVSGYGVEISDSLYTEDDFAFSGSAVAARTNVGTTNMGLATSQFTNTNANFAKVTFVVEDGFQKITPVASEVVVTITGNIDTKTYDGTEHSVSGYSFSSSNPLYTEADATFSGTATAARTDAGTTSMGLAAGQFANENANFANVVFRVTDGWMKINPRAVTVTIVGNNATNEYDGAQHSVEGYTATVDSGLYGVDANVVFDGTAVAARTNAGTTHMGLDAEQFTNTNENFAVTFEVTDGFQTIIPVKAAVTVTIVGNNATNDYDGAEHSVSGYSFSSSNPLYTEVDAAFSGTATAARTNEGTTYMGLKAADFANISANFETVVFVVTDGFQAIGAIDVVVTIVGNNATNVYDGAAHTVTGYTVTSISSDLYTESDFELTGAASATQTNVGTADMGLTESLFVNKNANFKNVVFEVTDGFQTITALPVTVDIVGNSATDAYDGAAHTVTGYTATANSALYNVQENVEFTGDATATRTDVGTTPMELAKSQFANTNSNFDVTFTVTDGFQAIIPSSEEVVVTIVGNTGTKTYDGASHEVTGYKVVSISNDLYTEADFTFTGSAAAARTDVGATAMGLAANQFANVSANFVNVKFVVTDGWLQITPLAVEVTIAGHTSSLPYDGEEHRVDGYDVTTISSALYTEDDIAFNGAATAARTNAGTTHMGLDAKRFTNMNNNFTVTFVVADGFQTIEKIHAVVTIIGNATVSDYDGMVHVATGYVASANTPLYNVESDIAFSGSAAASRTDVGTTPMGLAAGQFANTNDNFEDVTFEVTDGWVKINPISAVVTIVGNTGTKTYDGGNHTVSGYDISVNTPLYAASDVAFDGSATATRANVGTTPMGLDASQFRNTNPNFADVTFVVTDGWVKINPLAVTVTVVGNNSTSAYDGAAHTVTGYTATADSDLYNVNADFAFTGGATATRTDAGTAYMGLAADQFANTNDNFSVTFVVTDGYQAIGAVDAVVTIVGNNATSEYDGAAHMVQGYAATVDNELYDIDANVTFAGSAAATRTEVGTTNMGLAASQFTNTNNNFNVVFVVTDGFQAITPVASEVVVAIVGNSDSAIYDGVSHTIEGYTASASNPLYTSDDYEFTGVATATRTDAGTTPMGLNAAQFRNISSNFAKVTFVVTDGKMTITPLDVTVSIVGNQVAANYDGTVHTATGYEASADSALYNTENVAFTGTATAARTNAGTTYMGLAADQFTNTNSNFNVTFAVADGFVTVDPIDAVVTVVENSASAHYDGVEHSVSGYASMTADTSLYDVSASVAETPTAAWTAKGTLVGTYPVGIQPDDFANTNSNFAKVTFVIVDGALVVDDNEVPDDLVVTKTHDGSIDGTTAADLGATISFDVTVKNIYNEAKTVTLEEKEGFTLSETTFSLEPGQEKTVTATHVVTEADILAGTIDNTVRATFDGKGWEATDDVDPQTPRSGMDVVKTVANTPANGDYYEEGEQIAYLIVVTNTGNVELTDVALDDSLVPLDSLEGLAPGDSRTIEYTYTVTAEDVAAGTVLNTVTGFGTTPDDSNTATTTATSEIAAKTRLETIDDNETPLAQACWVHWWMILGMLVTLVYGAGVIVRRKKFTNNVAALDEELTGSEAKTASEAKAE